MFWCSLLSIGWFLGVDKVLLTVGRLKRFVCCLLSYSFVFIADERAFIENQTGNRVKALQTNNGAEIVNSQMSAFNTQHGVLHRTTVPFAHEQNGAIERINRTIRNGVHANLETYQQPDSLWLEAALTFIFVRNRLYPSTYSNKSQFEVIFGRTPNVAFLLPSVVPVAVYIPSERCASVTERPGLRGQVVGYKEDASYRILLQHNRIVYSRDIMRLSDVSPPSPASHGSGSITPQSSSSAGNRPADGP